MTKTVAVDFVTFIDGAESETIRGYKRANYGNGVVEYFFENRVRVIGSNRIDSITTRFEEVK